MRSVLKRNIGMFWAAFIIIFIFVAPLSAQITFERWYGGTGGEIGWYVDQTLDGGYIIAGETTSFGAGDYDAWFIKTDSLGDALWTKTYGGSGDEWGWCIQNTPDGGYITVGGTDSYGAGYYDFYLIKTDSLGNVGIEEKNLANSESPRVNELFSAVPNPFRNKTDITFSLGQSAKSVELRIYDVAGRLVKEFLLPTAYSLVPTVISSGMEKTRGAMRCRVVSIFADLLWGIFIQQKSSCACSEV